MRVKSVGLREIKNLLTAILRSDHPAFTPLKNFWKYWFPKFSNALENAKNQRQIILQRIKVLILEPLRKRTVRITEIIRTKDRAAGLTPKARDQPPDPLATEGTESGPRRMLENLIVVRIPAETDRIDPTLGIIEDLAVPPHGNRKGHARKVGPPQKWKKETTVVSTIILKRKKDA